MCCSVANHCQDHCILLYMSLHTAKQHDMHCVSWVGKPTSYCNYTLLWVVSLYNMRVLEYCVLSWFICHVFSGSSFTEQSLPFMCVSSLLVYVLLWCHPVKVCTNTHFPLGWGHVSEVSYLYLYIYIFPRVMVHIHFPLEVSRYISKSPL